MKRLGLVLLLLAACSVPASAREVEGVLLQETIDMGGRQLVLNGAGVRSKWFIDLYVAGLYLDAVSSDPGQVIVADRPLLLRLDVISGLISSEKMETATREGFDNAAATGYPAKAEQVDAFIDVFREEIEKGDRFELAYLPGEGVRVSKNGELRATLTGLSFKQALLAIWLGERPAQQSLKQALLGR